MFDFSNSFKWSKILPLIDDGRSRKVFSEQVMFFQIIFDATLKCSINSWEQLGDHVCVERLGNSANAPWFSSKISGLVK